MEGGGLPILNCLLQDTLRSLCTCADSSSSSSSSSSSKWVYAVFWRILPRNYPPPKWDCGGSFLDRSKGNKRNWNLVWEDGYCDFCECEREGRGCMKGRFGADVFFKMSHEVYNYGEGLVGKVAADNSHKWVFKETPTQSDPNLISSWNMTMEPQPRAWEFQFNSGIQTIAIVSVREGIVQLGSFEKIAEDLNLVISIQRKFSYLHSIPGVFAIQRPYLPIQHPYIIKPKGQAGETQELAFSVGDEKPRITRMKRLFDERCDDSPTKTLNLGWNTPHQNGISGPPVWPLPPHLPSMSCSLGALLTKLPSVIPSYTNVDSLDATPVICNGNTSTSHRTVKVDDGAALSEGNHLADAKLEEASCHLDAALRRKPIFINHSPDLDNEIVGFGPPRKGENALNLD